MNILQLFLLITIFFLTSIISVVTGSTSLITVPAMFQFGIEPRTAIATNMLALTFMSVGGTLPFLGKKAIDRRRLPLLIALTLAGSLLGALLVLIVPSKTMPLLISILMIAVAGFSIAQHDAGVVRASENPSQVMEIGGYAATFVLGIYGGFFSGGYVTLLTAAYVTLFRMTFVEAIASTKLINVFSSLVATIIFTVRGIVDYKLGIILSITMFIGGIIGSHFALRVSNVWLRRIFLTTVIALALKTLLFNFAAGKSPFEKAISEMGVFHYEYERAILPNYSNRRESVKTYMNLVETYPTLLGTPTLRERYSSRRATPNANRGTGTLASRLARAASAPCTRIR